MRKANSKPRVLFIFPGPSYRLADSYGQRMAGLSSDYSGVLLTSRPSPQALRLNDFLAVAVRKRKSNLITAIRCLWIIHRLYKSKRFRNSLRLIVSYDPLRSGVISVICSWLFRVPLAVEVNGDYASPHNYFDSRTAIQGKLKRAIYVAVEKFVIRHANGVKLLHAAQIDNLEIDMSNKIVCCFPNLINVDNFKSTKNKPIILTVGFPFHIKGVDILVAAFKMIAKNHPLWTLKVLGHSKNPELLQKLINNNRQIQFHPAVPHSEMPKHMGECGLFVLASRTEAMGRVLVEAMASSKPRIGTAVGGIPYVICDGVDGLLVPPEDVSALAEAMDRLLSDKQLRISLGQAAKQRVNSEFLPRQYFENTYQFYSKILNATSSCAK